MFGLHEKEWAAVSSVIAAVGLTFFKLIVGFSTGSLGILAEAAHSGLDLVAALMTAFAVRISSRPADKGHPYGHGKVENLSALFETLLLLITCVWIILEASKNLLSRHIQIEVTFWSFSVMAISILVDISRSRMLYKAAKKFNSQALEADALHFQTDIWSSAVVILGLICVKLSDFFPHLSFLRFADSVAALIVGLIVVKISWDLGMRSVGALMDSAPAGIEEKIVALVEAVPGVINCHQLRVRVSGPQLFIDLHILVDGNQTLRKAHDLTDLIEEKIQQMYSNADVTVHPEPDSAER